MIKIILACVASCYFGMAMMSCLKAEQKYFGEYAYKGGDIDE